MKMKSRMRWPRHSFLCAIGFLCGASLIRTWLENQQLFCLTTFSVLRCWGLYVESRDSSPSDSSITGQVARHRTEAFNIPTSLAAPHRHTPKTSAFFDPNSSFDPVTPPPGFSAFSESTAAVDDEQLHVHSPTSTRAWSVNTKRKTLRGPLKPESRLFSFVGKASNQFPFYQANSTDGNESNVESLLERGESRSGLAPARHGALSATNQHGLDRGDGIRDLLSPAHLLEPNDYAASLTAEVHGTFADHDISSHQQTEDGNESLQSLLVKGACRSTGSSSTGQIRNCDPGTSRNSDVVRPRKHEKSSSSAPYNKKTAAHGTTVARLRETGEAFNEACSGGCGDEAKFHTVRAHGLSSSSNDSYSLPEAVREHAKFVEQVHTSPPVAFLQEEKTVQSAQPQQEKEDGSIPGALATESRTKNVAAGLTVRHADMPITNHADAFLQQYISGDKLSEEMNVEETQRELEPRTVGAAAEGKENAGANRSELLHQRGSGLALAENNVNKASWKSTVASEIKKQRDREQEHQGTVSVGMFPHGPIGSYLDTAATEKKEAGPRKSDAMIESHKAVGKRVPAGLVETTAGEDEPEEEEGEVSGEAAGEGDDESAGTKEGEGEEGEAATDASAAKEAEEPAENGEAGVKVEEKEPLKKESATTVTKEATVSQTEGERGEQHEDEEEEGSVEEREEKKPEKEHHAEKTETVTVVTETENGGETAEKSETKKKEEKKATEEHLHAMEKTEHIEAVKKEDKKAAVEKGAEIEKKGEKAEQPGESALKKQHIAEEKLVKAEEPDEAALKRQHRAEEKLEKPTELLQEHRLSGGGPRGSTTFRSHSYVNEQDELQHKQLQEASEMASRLTRHLQRQNVLKEQEMHLKRREMAHINQLHHFEQALQSVISTVWRKLETMRNRLKRMIMETRSIAEKFLKKTGHRVLRPEETPLTVHPTPAEQQQVVAKTAHGIPGEECPTETVNGLKGGREPSLATVTLYTTNDASQKKLPSGTASAAEQRVLNVEVGRPLEEISAYCCLRPERPLPQPLLIHGRNLSTCLRLLTVHEKTRCSPDSSEVVEETLKDAQNLRAQPAPHLLEEDAILFENVEVPEAGNYKLCLLQYWVPPGAKKGDKVFVLGVDEVGTLAVLPAPDDTVVAKLKKAEEEAAEKERKKREMEAGKQGLEEKQNDTKERKEEAEVAGEHKKKEADAADEHKGAKEKEAHSKMLEAAEAEIAKEEKQKNL